MQIFPLFPRKMIFTLMLRDALFQRVHRNVMVYPPQFPREHLHPHEQLFTPDGRFRAMAKCNDFSSRKQKKSQTAFIILGSRALGGRRSPLTLLDKKAKEESK